jgi:hypothetical protein
MSFVCFGCSSQQHVSETALGGPYYLKSIMLDSWLMEPGGGGWEFHLLYRDDSGRTVVISTHATGGIDELFQTGYDAHIYGSNLVYLERYEVPSTVPSDLKNGIASRRLRLMAYSEKNGIITIERDFQNCWKATGDERGITCYRYREDPNPRVFSAEYLKGL